MTQTFTYPSAQFPPFPGLALTVPDTWVPVTAPGAWVAGRAVVPEDRFAANVVVTLARYLTGFDTADALSLLRDELREHESAKIDEPFTAVFGEDRYLIVNVAYDHPIAGTLVQVHAFRAYPVANGDPSHQDVVHVMGTCAAVDATTDYPMLQQVMETVRVTPARLDDVPSTSQHGATTSP